MGSMNNDVYKIAKNVFGKWLHTDLSDTLRRSVVESARSERESVCVCVYITKDELLLVIIVRLHLPFWRHFKWSYRYFLVSEGEPSNDTVTKAEPLLPLLQRILIHSHLATSVVDMAYLNYWQASANEMLLMLSYPALSS